MSDRNKPTMPIKEQQTHSSPRAAIAWSMLLSWHWLKSKLNAKSGGKRTNSMQKDEFVAKESVQISDKRRSSELNGKTILT